MKIELKSREGCAYKKLCGSSSETHSETELIIPDTLEDILRILCCRYQCRIREKLVSADAVDILGDIDITVVYVPDTGDGVRVVGTSVPFELHFDAPGADSTSLAVTRLSSLSVDARAVNPRKISLSANVFMEQSSFKYADLCWTEPPAGPLDKLFFRSSELECKSIVLVSEKTLSIEDELELPEPLRGGDFVKGFSRICLGGSEVVGTKLIVRGTAEIEAIYLVSGLPRTARFSIPFSQLFNLPDGCTEVEADSCAMITGQYFEPFDAGLSADIRAAIQLVCLRDESVSYISDAYSCTHQLELTQCELDCIVSTQELRQSSSVRLSYNSDYGADEIMLSSAFADCPQLSDSSILIPVTADIVYRDREGALRACRVRGSAELELSDERHPDEVSVDSISVSAAATGDSVSADTGLDITIRYIKRKSISMISGIEETEREREKPDAALYMCRCEDGNLWSLAKKYASDAELIKLINETDGEDTADRLLLIPVI